MQTPNQNGNHAEHQDTLTNSKNECSKTINQQTLQLSQALMSQDSIQHMIDDGQKETLMERKRLDQQEMERQNYAKNRFSQQDDQPDRSNNESNCLMDHAFQVPKNVPAKGKFGKKDDGTTKKERLDELLQKTEQYTHFILQQNIKQHRSQIKNSKQLNRDKLQGTAQNGKISVSKRRQKQKCSESSDDENETLLTRLTVQPSILEGLPNNPHTLRNYQLDGLNWMIGLYETGINGILADEMGLGKTIQTISLIAFLKEFKQINGYHIIIMPKAVIGNWVKEFKKWLPECRVINLIATKERREEIVKNQLQPNKFDVVLTTYEGVRLCMGPLMKFKWQYIIIDEAQKIKNEDSQISKRVRQFHCKYRLLLTGTPLQNNLHELWSLLNFLLPEIFKSSEDFDEWFDLSGGIELSDKEKEIKNNNMITQLHKILRPFMLRRIKKEVEKSLLPKIEMHINVGITETQKSIYRQLLKKSTIDNGSSSSHYHNILIQLRKVCNHPYLFKGVEEDDAPELGQHIIDKSGKMHVLDKLLKKAKQDDSQTLIFSGFTTMLDILEDYCRFREYKYCRLDGNTELDDRQIQIDDFTSPETDKTVFLISTRAGGLGLNLMSANTVILYDSDWNPQMDLQAMDRAHRIGQTKQVKVYRLITKNTMEEKMVEKQTMKLKLDQLIIQKGRMAPKNTGMQKNDLQDMVNFGADAIFEIGSDVDDDDIEAIIKDGEEKALKLQLQAEKVMKEKFDMVNFQMNSCNLYQFEDIDYLHEKRKDAKDLLKRNVIALMETETNLTSRRKVQKNMAENNLFPNIFANGNIGVSNDAKKKRLHKVQDFRFFPNSDRLKELIELEMENKYSGYIQGSTVQTFTPEMKIEKELIESKGFPDWDRRDFQRFIQGLELYAKNDYENICLHMDGTKTASDVQKYSQIFFVKVDTLNDKEKIKAKINKAQKFVNFNLRAPQIIRNKINSYQNPIEEMILPFATQKSKFFSKETDSILINITYQCGYGNWQKIKESVRRHIRCRMDHVFTSRNDEEIKKRVIYLVQCLEKEEEEGKQNIINDEQMETKYQQLMKEAEEKADEAMNNLTLTSIIRISTHGLDYAPNQVQTTKTKNNDSQDTLKSVKMEIESQNDCDKQMNSEQDCEYDKGSEEVEQEQKFQIKKTKNKTQKDNQSIDSENAIRINGNRTQEVLDEEMEENEILAREMGSPQKNQSQEQDSGLNNSNGINTTIETLNEKKKSPVEQASLKGWMTGEKRTYSQRDSKKRR